MLLIQVFIVTFAVFALTRAIVRFREGGLGRKRLLLWAAAWIGVAIVVLLPQSANVLAGILGVGRGADAVIYVAIVLLFYLVFRLYLLIERLEHQITLLVREIGLHEDEERAEDEAMT